MPKDTTSRADLDGETPKIRTRLVILYGCNGPRIHRIASVTNLDFDNEDKICDPAPLSRGNTDMKEPRSLCPPVTAHSQHCQVRRG